MYAVVQRPPESAAESVPVAVNLGELHYMHRIGGSRVGSRVGSAYVYVQYSMMISCVVFRSLS